MLDQLFERLYVINLPERQDRRRAVLRELQQLQISPNTAKLDIFPAIKPETAGDFPSIGARGCFLSHLAILTAARDQQLGNVLIMEDDVGFSPSFVKYQSPILAELTRLNWDFLYLGHVLPSLPVPKPTRLSAPGSFVDWQITTVGLQTTHCLAINGQILPRLVEFLEELLTRPAGHPQGGPMHVDGAYSTFRAQNPDIVTLIAQPCLAVQCSSPSDVAEAKWFAQISVLKPLADLGRALQTYARKRSVSR
jgi:glycosyl transferase, family 25